MSLTRRSLRCGIQVNDRPRSLVCSGMFCEGQENGVQVISDDGTHCDELTDGQSQSTGDEQRGNNNLMGNTA